MAGDADGSFRRAEPPPPVDGDEALAILGRRYLAGYGPAGPGDLARWSGLPITACRREGRGWPMGGFRGSGAGEAIPPDPRAERSATGEAGRIYSLLNVSRATN